MIVGFDAFVDAFSTVAIPYLGLTENEASWFASVECFFVCFFAPIGGKIADVVGKKIVIMILAPILAAGWILMALSESTVVLFTGRILSSIASGTMLPLPSEYS